MAASGQVQTLTTLAGTSASEGTPDVIGQKADIEPEPPKRSTRPGFDHSTATPVFEIGVQIENTSFEDIADASETGTLSGQVEGVKVAA